MNPKCGIFRSFFIPFFCFVATILYGCSTDKPRDNFSYQEMAARDEGNQEGGVCARPTVYRAKAPLSWLRKDPDPSESIADTTKPLCEFIIDEQEKGRVRITVHNFPSEAAKERIPPISQVARWKRQFAELDPTTVSLVPQAHGGFSGLFFEGSGFLANERVTMMAWTMQLASEHYSTLSFRISSSHVPEDVNFLKQERADYTIKAVGPTALMTKHRRDIMTFARSFELIREILQN